MKLLWSKREPYSLKRTLLFTFFTAILICFGVGLYIFLTAMFLLEDMTTFVETSRRFSDAQTNLNAVQDDIDNYLFSRSTQSLRSYYDNYNKLQSNADAFRKLAASTNSAIKFKNVNGLIQSYLTTAEDVMMAKRTEKTSQYLHTYQQVTEQYRDLKEYIQGIMATDMQKSAQQYEEMQITIQQRTMVSYILFGISIVFIVFIVVTLSTTVTRPITRLADYAKRVALGEYDIVIEKDDSSRELSNLYGAFDIMVSNTRLYLDGLTERQNLADELTQQKIKGLEFDNVLHHAQLKALHAQMNPHFIFNTINIGAKVAMMQGDHVVCDYLETAADVFRYNLEGLSEATLTNELDNVAAYMKLLMVRFGAKLIYNVSVDSDVNTDKYLLPRMTLQPLVENAFIHGISPCEEGGRIRVDVNRREDHAVIVISNTGVEFPQQQIEALYANTDRKGEENSGHLSGIGLKNVIKRLQLQFQTEQPIQVVSVSGQTNVTLMVPLKSD